MMAHRPLGPVVVDLISTSVNSDEQRLLSHPMVGGVILFSRNYESVEQLVQLTSQIREINPHLVIMVDQEGGRVQRFKTGFTRLPPLQKIGALYGQEPARAKQLANQHAWLMASELLNSGVDLSLAPVLDMDDQFSDVIGDRSFGSAAEAVTELAESYIAGMNLAGMASVAKHFPGHGIVKGDSHKVLPTATEGLVEVESSHMQPFKALVNLYTGVMPAHIVYKNVDARPVGFSSYWLQQILRDKLGFTGVIFSDDLSMAGAQWAGDYTERAEAALTAGCDVVLVCNQPDAALQVVNHLEQRGWPVNGALTRLKGKLPNNPIGSKSLSSTELWQNCARNLSAL